MYYHKFTAKGIQIILAGSGDGITQLLIDNGLRDIQIKGDWQPDSELFAETEKQIHEYLNGQRAEFQLKLNPQGTDFQKKVWKALEQIPYGELFSYKQIATIIGNPNASRAIGLANNRNPIPIIIPCHRVVGSNKKLVGYAYGLELKQHLIELEAINKVFRALAKYYGAIHRAGFDNKKSWWPSKTHFEMMIGAILTQNTNWKNVEKALSNMEGNISPHFIIETNEEKLAEMIRPSGYHNQKARKLKALCAWYGKYNFSIDEVRKNNQTSLRKELLEINGVGPETADSMLVYAFDKPSFVIDAYTRRIFSRVGLNIPSDYDEFRVKIENTISRDIEIFDYYHGLLVEHAKAFCTKVPKCGNCPLNQICDKNIETNQKKLNL